MYEIQGAYMLKKKRNVAQFRVLRDRTRPTRVGSCTHLVTPSPVQRQRDCDKQVCPENAYEGNFFDQNLVVS